MGRKDFRVSWVPTMTRFLSMPAREVTKEGPTGEQMGAAIRSQRISRGGNHGHQDGEAPWEHSSCMETPKGHRRTETTTERLGKMNYTSSKGRQSKAAWNNAQTRHPSPSAIRTCQYHLEKTKGKGKSPKAVSKLETLNRLNTQAYLNETEFIQIRVSN